MLRQMPLYAAAFLTDIGPDHDRRGHGKSKEDITHGLLHRLCPWSISRIVRRCERRVCAGGKPILTLFQQVSPVWMALEQCRDIGTFGHDPEPFRAGIGHHGFNQPSRHPAPANRGGNQRMIGNPGRASQLPGQSPDCLMAGKVGVIFAAATAAVAGNGHLIQIIAPA